MSQICNILFQAGDINIFVLHGVFFSRHVQLKAFLAKKKNTALKFETDFSCKAIENERGKLLKEKLHH